VLGISFGLGHREKISETLRAS